MLAVWLLQAWGPGDAYVYLAAGERLNAGHELYALQPGDRYVWINPPFWTVPLLSPPLIAVVWRPLAALPNELGVALWWIGSSTAALVVLGAMVRRASALVGAMLVALAIPFAFIVGSGNVDAFRLAATVAVWRLVSRRRELGGGVLVGALIVLKLTPIALAWWLLLLGSRRGVAGVAIGTAAAAVVSIAGAGVGPHLQLPEILAQSYAAGPTRESLTGLGLMLGIDPAIAKWFTVAAGAFCLLAMIPLRHHPAPTFTLAVIAAVVGSAAGGLHSWAMLLAAAAPLVWPVRPRTPEHAVPVPAAA